MKEEWKWIKGYEDLYAISNFGNVVSFYGNEKYKKISLKNKDGWYLSFRAVDKNGTKKTLRVHVEVAKAFIGEIPKSYHVHHKDGNKQNNRVDNLEIISPKEHCKESIKQNPDICAGMNDYNKYKRPKHIVQYDLENHFIAEYANAAIASKLTGICQRNILQVANKEPFNNKGSIRKQAGGYVWKYTDEREVM